jgi:hypothetical protein
VAKWALHAGSRGAVRLIEALRVVVRADASGAMLALEYLYEEMLDLFMKLYYHDDLCGMNDETEWDVFV